MKRRRVLQSVLILALASAAGCREADPLADRLNDRKTFAVDLVTFSLREDNEFLVELEVRSTLSRRIPTLTVSVRQHDAQGAELGVYRAPLDLREMDETGSMRVYTRVPRHSEGVDALSVFVEYEPPRGEYGEFPELQEVAGS